jgi:hypothetical protein
MQLVRKALNKEGRLTCVNAKLVSHLRKLIIMNYIIIYLIQGHRHLQE